MMAFTLTPDEVLVAVSVAAAVMSVVAAWLAWVNR